MNDNTSYAITAVAICVMMGIIALSGAYIESSRNQAMVECAKAGLEWKVSQCIKPEPKK